jgi:hypothetical protein
VLKEFSTTLEVVGEISRFHVETSNPTYRDLLVHMGFSRSGDTDHARDFPATPHIARIHENFARHLEEILQQGARLRPIPWDRALREFLRRMEASGVDWWLSGSAALAVRGIDVAPGDLDFVVSDARGVGEIFSDLLVYPVTKMKGWAAEWFGCAFHEAVFEWVAVVHPDAFYGPGPHEQGPEAVSRLETVDWEGHLIRVTPLDLQLAVAELRSQHERAAKIRTALSDRHPHNQPDARRLAPRRRRALSPYVGKLLEEDDFNLLW